MQHDFDWWSAVKLKLPVHVAKCCWYVHWNVSLTSHQLNHPKLSEVCGMRWLNLCHLTAAPLPEASNSAKHYLTRSCTIVTIQNTAYTTCCLLSVIRVCGHIQTGLLLCGSQTQIQTYKHTHVQICIKQSSSVYWKFSNPKQRNGLLNVLVFTRIRGSLSAEQSRLVTDGSRSVGSR